MYSIVKKTIHILLNFYISNNVNFNLHICIGEQAKTVGDSLKNMKKLKIIKFGGYGFTPELILPLLKGLGACQSLETVDTRSFNAQE